MSLSIGGGGGLGNTIPKAIVETDRTKAVTFLINK